MFRSLPRLPLVADDRTATSLYRPVSRLPESLRCSPIAKGFRGFGVKHSATGDDQRSCSLAPIQLAALFQSSSITAVARNVPDSFAKKFFGKIESLSLHILRQGKRNCAGLSGRSQDSKRFRKGSQQLLRTLNAVPVTGDGLKQSFTEMSWSLRRLQLLQDRRNFAAGENISGKQQDR